MLGCFGRELLSGIFHLKIPLLMRLHTSVPLRSLDFETPFPANWFIMWLVLSPHPRLDLRGMRNKIRTRTPCISEHLLGPWFDPRARGSQLAASSVSPVLSPERCEIRVGLQANLRGPFEIDNQSLFYAIQIDRFPPRLKAKLLAGPQQMSRPPSLTAFQTWSSLWITLPAWRCLVDRWTTLDWPWKWSSCFDSTKQPDFLL